MYQRFLKLLFLLTVVVLQGCYDKDGVFVGPNFSGPYDHIVDLDLVHTSRHKGVVPVEYELKGVYGPDRLHISNSKEVSTVLKLDLIDVPEVSDVQLEEDALEKLTNIAESHTRNYFGAHKRIIVFVLKRFVEHKMKYFVLDVKTPENKLSLADYLVTRGLVKVNREVAELSGMDYLIQLEKEAQDDNLGLWENY